MTMTPQPPGRRWVRRHPVLTVLWLIIGGIWLAAIIAVYDDDPGVSLFAYLVPMALVTLIALGLGAVLDRVRQSPGAVADARFPRPDHLSPSERPIDPGVSALQRKLHDETQRQRDLALQLDRREAELGRREADLQAREALLQSEPPRQPVPAQMPDSKTLTDAAVMQPDRLPDQSAPAKFCFNCGAWFARDDQTCRLCGARRVGAEV